MKVLFFIAMFVSGAVLATLGDMAHVYSKTTGYPMDRYYFYFWKLPFWVPLLFGTATVAISAMHLIVDADLRKRHWKKYFPPPVPLWPWGISSSILFTVAYCASGFLPWTAGSWGDLFLWVFALMVRYFYDRSPVGFALAVYVSVMGTLVEIFFVGNNIFFYQEKARNLFGVASWLPALYFIASVNVGGVSRGVMHQLEKKSAKADARDDSKPHHSGH